MYGREHKTKRGVHSSVRIGALRKEKKKKELETKVLLNRQYLLATAASCWR